HAPSHYARLRRGLLCVNGNRHCRRSRLQANTAPVYGHFEPLLAASSCIFSLNCYNPSNQSGAPPVAERCHYSPKEFPVKKLLLVVLLTPLFAAGPGPAGLIVWKSDDLKNYAKPLAPKMNEHKSANE